MPRLAAEHRSALRALASGFLPFALAALIYRTMSPESSGAVSAARVHICDLRALEMRIAGISIDGRRATVHDWLQRHATLGLDVLCAIPYGTFLLACAVFLVFSSLRDAPRGRQFGWGFLALNVLAFITYRLYPAAPPWYFHAHGCVAEVAAHASEGPNLARVDGWLGVHYFGAMYAQSRVVFGAMPSLHCAYALLIVLDGWPLFGRTMRLASLLYASLMAFAAVYLDHHWVVDVVAGDAFAVVVIVAVRSVANWFERAAWWRA
jgi:membrane-associated phospholipid phosphatase